MVTTTVQVPEVEPEKKNLREDILLLEKTLSKMPGAVFGDSDLMPLKHSFAEGVYVREIFIPKGTALTGKIHRHSHPNFLMKGEVIVVTEGGGREHLKAPLSIISKPGTKRAILALEDTVWITVHATTETDLAKIEDYVIAPTYADLLTSEEKAMLESELSRKNCLILALKEKERDFNCLLSLKADGILLPFKDSIEKLRQNDIPIDGLLAEKQSHGIWHVSLCKGIPLNELNLQAEDMVGSWVAVAVGVVGVGTAVYANNNKPDTPSAAPPDPNMNALQQEQLKLLQQQGDQQSAFSPILAEQMGYTETRTPTQVTNPQIKETKDAVNYLTNVLNAGPDRNGNYSAGGKTFTEETLKDNIAGNQRVLDGLPATVGSTTDYTTSYAKTAERTAQDKQLADLQSAQMATAQKANDSLNKYLDSLNTDDYKTYQAAQQQLQEQQTQIALAQGTRTQQALEGKLPLSQGTIDRKAADFQLLKENLARSGNAIIGDDPASAYSLSSPGVQALKAFNQQYGTIEAQERQGQLDTGSQAYLQSVGLSGNIGQNALTTTGQLSNPGGYASTSTSLNPNTSPVANNASLIQGYSSAINPYIQQQQLGQQASQFGAQMNSQNQAGYLNLAGTTIGAGLGAYAASNRRFKKNIEAIGSERDATKAIAKTPVYRWNYKNEPDGHKKHLGTMTDEAPEDVVTEDGDFLDVTSYMGLLTLSTKDLHNRVLSLEGRGR